MAATDAVCGFPDCAVELPVLNAAQFDLESKFVASNFELAALEIEEMVTRVSGGSWLCTGCSEFANQRFSVAFLGFAFLLRRQAGNSDGWAEA